MKNKGLVNIYSSECRKGLAPVTEKRFFYLVVMMAWVFFTPVTGHGEDIRIRSGVAVVAGKSELEIRLRSVNDSPASVYDLKVLMETPWKTSESLVRPAWPPYEENRVMFTVIPPKGARGCYPMVLALTFRDKAGIPVTVYEVATVSTGHDVNAQVMDLSATGAEFEIKGNLHVLVQNNGHETQTVHCRLVAPPSLAVERDRIEIRVKPGSPSTVRFHIMNRHAAPGTIVPVFVLAETDANGIHRTAFIRSTIRTLTAREARRPLRAVLWILLLLSGGYSVILFYRQTA